MVLNQKLSTERIRGNHKQIPQQSIGIAKRCMLYLVLHDRKSGVGPVRRAGIAAAIDKSSAATRAPGELRNRNTRRTPQRHDASLLRNYFCLCTLVIS